MDDAMVCTRYSCTRIILNLT
eukprot:SAG11_NODE_11618_length_748_cov_1.665639_2_plen_20_part_01